MYSFKYNQQDVVLYNTLLLAMLYTFQAVSPPIIRSSKLYTHSIWYVSSLLAATASGSSKQAAISSVCSPRVCHAVVTVTYLT